MNELKEGIDYYINEKGLVVFTKAYHIKRGYCCKSGCLHCPFGFKIENIVTKNSGNHNNTQCHIEKKN